MSKIRAIAKCFHWLKNRALEAGHALRVLTVFPSWASHAFNVRLRQATPCLTEFPSSATEHIAGINMASQRPWSRP